MSCSIEVPEHNLLMNPVPPYVLCKTTRQIYKFNRSQENKMEALAGYSGKGKGNHRSYAEQREKYVNIITI